MRILLGCIALILAMGITAEVTEEQADSKVQEEEKKKKEKEEEEKANLYMELAMKEISAKRSIATAKENLICAEDFITYFVTILPNADGDMCQFDSQRLEHDLAEAVEQINSIVPPSAHDVESIKAWNAAKSETWRKARSLAEEVSAQCTDFIAMLQQHPFADTNFDALKTQVKELRLLPFVDLPNLTEAVSQLGKAQSLWRNADSAYIEAIAKVHDELNAIEASAIESKRLDKENKENRREKIKNVAEVGFLLLVFVLFYFRAVR